MSNRLKSALTAFMVPGFLLLASTGYAAEIGSHKFKFTTQNPKGHPIAEGAQKFADLVEEKSGGNMTVKLFLGGVLGGDVETISAMQGGTIEMASMNAGLLSGNVKEFGVLDFPFLFADPKEADAVMDGAVGKRLMDQLPDKGLVGLAYWELGFRSVTNSRRAIEKAEDIEGLKLRTLQSPIYIDAFNALGANAVPLPFPELYTALETGTVDGQENPPSVILANSLFEVQKYLTLTRHAYNPQILMISKKAWDGLNADEQKVLQDAATESRDYQRQLAREANDKAIEDLKADGMEVNELPKEEVDKLSEKVKPVVDKYAAEVGQDLVDELYAEIKKVRGTN